MSLDLVQNLIQQESITFIDFGAKWCGPCKKLKSVFTQAVKTYPKCNFLTIDIDENCGTAEYFEITTVPNVMVFKKGKKIGQQVGFQGEKEFFDFIETMIKKGK